MWSFTWSPANHLLCWHLAARKTTHFSNKHQHTKRTFSNQTVSAVVVPHHRTHTIKLKKIDENFDERLQRCCSHIYFFTKTVIKNFHPRFSEWETAESGILTLLFTISGHLKLEIVVSDKDIGLNKLVEEGVNGSRQLIGTLTYL